MIKHKLTFTSLQPCFTYFILAIVAFTFNKIYALFGHGVTSVWMSSISFVLIIFGILFFAILKFLMPDFANRKGNTWFYRLYHTGIAFFVNGMLLKGIIDIAGGTSYYTFWFMFCGIFFILIAIIQLIRMTIAQEYL